MTIPPILILSTGRCGSTLLSNMLARHPAVLSLSEFFVPLGSAAFAHRAPGGAELWSVLSRQTPALHMMLEDGIIVDEGLYPFDKPGALFTPADIPPVMCVTLPHLTEAHEALYDELEPLIRARPARPLAEQYRFLFEHLAAKYHRRVWIERSGGSLMLAPRLLKLFPDARVIHVYRDGRDTALSMSRHHNFRMLLAVLEKARRLGVDTTRNWTRSDISPWPMRLEKLLFRLWDVEAMKRQTYPVTEYGRLWSRMIELGSAALAGLPPERLLSVRFEDVQQQPREQLDALIRFIHPDLADTAWLDEACAMLRPTRSQYLGLPEAERQALTEACAPGLRRLGYLG